MVPIIIAEEEDSTNVDLLELEENSSLRVESRTSSPFDFAFLLTSFNASLEMSVAKVSKNNASSLSLLQT